MNQQTARPSNADSAPVAPPRALHEIEAVAGPATQLKMTASPRTGPQTHSAWVWVGAIFAFILVAYLFGAVMSLFH